MTPDTLPERPATVPVPQPAPDDRGDPNAPILQTCKPIGGSLILFVGKIERVYELPTVPLPDQLLLVQADPQAPERAHVWKASICRHRYLGRARLIGSKEGSTIRNGSGEVIHRP